MKVRKTSLKDFYIIELDNYRDNRGQFVKTFNEEIFAQHNLKINFTESFYSISNKNVIRGIHFQKPPDQHTKLVFLTHGKVFDVVVDLRTSSSDYGKHEIVILDSAKAEMLYIPEGFGHGFYTLSNKAIVSYITSTVYSPKNDGGIRWNSLGIPWPTEGPILSEKDKELTLFSNFKSPFF